MELSSLSLKQKIGQLLCLGWDATGGARADTVNAHAREIVQELGAGAVILMGRNVSTPAQTRELTAELQSLAQISLFVAVDQEGGMVNRFSPPVHQFPGNMALGAIANREEEGAHTTATRYAERQARAQARELRELGVNWNFAPVVDVNNNPNNPIIGVRSYGENPWLAAEHGVGAVQGYQAEGVLACAKHFPGHGDTAIDSHLALPTITGDRARLEAVELLPFRALIAAGAGAIMTTHILFPALDAERPATLSQAVLAGLLRDEMGFDGLVITDCLEMNAIADTVGTAQGALKAIQAGADMALICHTLKTQREAYRVLLEAAQLGALPIARLDAAVGRVLAAKKRMSIGTEQRQENTGAAATPAYLDPAHGALEQEIARASITVVRHNEHFPLRLASTDELLILSGHSAGQRLTTHLQKHHANARCLLWKKMDDAFRAQALEQVAWAGAVIAATLPPEAFSRERVSPQVQAAFVRELHALLGAKLIVVALREPYALRHFPDVENYVCTYGHRPCSLDALADALFGVYKPTGRLPVTIPDVQTTKKSLQSKPVEEGAM